MKLTVIGCSGSCASPDAAASCYLVEAGGLRLLLDFGSGSFGPLQQHVDAAAIDAVLFSHLHADHCLDLCGFYVSRKYRPGGPLPPIPVFGPAGVADRMAAAYGTEPAPGLREHFDFREWTAGEPVELGPVTVSVAPVEHPVEAYAIRVEHAGRVLAYSGDAGPCDGLLRAAADADVFLCEATFVGPGPYPPKLHLSGRQAGEYASKAGAGRLVLTHIPPWNDPQRPLAEAASAYGGPIELARPGFTLTI